MLEYARISLIYLDYIKESFINKIKDTISKNNNNKSTINIKINEHIISTLNQLPNNQSNFECPKCNGSYNLEQNSFYFCTQCKETSFFCEECYKTFNAANKNKNKTKEKEKQIFHEHHLILFYKYSQNKTSFIIKDIYNKYMFLLKGKKSKKIYLKL